MAATFGSDLLDDSLVGGASNDAIFGGASGGTGGGNDQLYGADAADTLFGGADADTLYGGAGADRLFGGLGDDTLQADVNDTAVIGGAGSDTARFTEGADVLAGARDLAVERVELLGGNDVFDVTASSPMSSTFQLSALDGTNGFRLDGAAADQSGISVASAGDVNGDSYADLIVGAFAASPNGVSSGSSYVVFGRASGWTADLDLSSLDGTSGFRLDGVAAGDYSGFSVASAGDVNGDGFDDVIVGAYSANPNGVDSGSSYVVFGRASGWTADLDLSSLDGTTGFRLDGAAALDYSGWSVASVGDTNGDGFGDIIVGALWANPNGGDSGSSYVVFGRASGWTADLDLSSLDGTSGFRLDGVAAGDQSGRSVASAGDVNGDGFDDVIVGAWGANPNGSYSGSSYVVFGKGAGWTADLDLSSLDGTSGFRFDGVAANDYSGWSVASTGDVNGDGFDDLIVGAYSANPNGGDSGSSYVVFGKGAGWTSDLDLSSLDGTTGFRLDGVAADDRSGYSVASAGDVNGDGYADLIVGAYQADPNGTSSGSSYVVFGRASGWAADLDLSSLDGATGFRLDGVAAGDRSGASVASAGDVDGDGFDDLIVGAYSADPNGTDSGSSYVVFGGAHFGAGAGGAGYAVDGGTGDDTLSGQAAADSLFGGEHNDVLTGRDGADRLYGASGVDSLYGGAGVDVLVGGLGADVMAGGAGGDAYYIDDAGDAIDETGGGDGVDSAYIQVDGYTVSDAVERIVVSGAAGRTATAGATDNVVYGAGGNDILYAGDGNDGVWGGAAGADQLYGGVGADSAYGGTEDDILFGGDGGDGLWGGAGNDGLYGEAGDDTMRGGAGNDYLSAEVGSDTAYGEAGDDSLDGGDDDDRLFGGDGDDSVAGEAGADVLYGGAGYNSLVGGDGADTLYAGADGYIFGDAGDDRLYGGTAGVRIADGDGADMAWGGSGGETFYGGAGSDVLYGGGGGDSFRFVAFDGSADTIYGGVGADGLDVYYTGGDAVVVSSSGINGTVVVGASSIAFYGIEGARNLGGGDGADTLRGSAVGDFFVGGAGGDSIYAHTGDDYADGDAGADKLWGAAGYDQLYGGDDADFIYGGDGNDGTLGGGAGNDSIWGDAGDDLIDGGADDDRLYGGIGDDDVRAGAGDDRLYAGAGVDWLDGGAGNDTYYGDADGAADTFLFNSTGFGADTIFGFEDGMDLIWLYQVDGVADFADLTITPVSGGSSLITLPGGESIRVIGVAPGQLTAADFDIDPPPI